MTTSFKRAAAVAVLLLAASTAEAQGRRGMQGFEQGESLVAVNWEVSAPIADLNSYISNWSFRGWSVEGRYKFHPRISLGGSLSMNRWEQTTSNALVSLANGNISGPLYRYVDMFSPRVIAHYYLMDGALQPYIGVGIGGVWAYSYQQVVDLANTKDSFDFIVNPEIGLLYQVVSGPTSLHINLAFRYTFTTANLVKGSDAQWLTIPVLGLAWSY